jgi:hypothetical protein
MDNYIHPECFPFVLHVGADQVNTLYREDRGPGLVCVARRDPAKSPPPSDYHLTGDLSRNYLNMGQLLYINTLSSIRFEYDARRDCYKVYAWTSDLDENTGNLKGVYSAGAARLDFPAAFSFRRSLEDRQTFEVSRGTLA